MCKRGRPGVLDAIDSHLATLASVHADHRPRFDGADRRGVHGCLRRARLKEDQTRRQRDRRAGRHRDVSEAEVGNEIPLGDCTHEAVKDQGGIVASRRDALHDLRQPLAAAFLVQWVVKQRPALQDGTAIGKQGSGVLDRCVVNLVVRRREHCARTVSMSLGVGGKARLVPLDRVAVGADRRYGLPVGREVLRVQEPRAHRDPVGTQMLRHHGLSQERVGPYFAVLGQAPDPNVIPRLRQGEDRTPRTHGREVGVVGHDEFIRFSNKASEMSDGITISTNVIVCVRPHDQGVRMRSEHSRSGDVKRRVGHHKQVRGVRT